MHVCGDMYRIAHLLKNGNIIQFKRPYKCSYGSYNQSVLFQIHHSNFYIMHAWAFFSPREGASYNPRKAWKDSCHIRLLL